jgi:hypothetical protein
MPALSFENVHSGGDSFGSCNLMELSFCLACFQFTAQSSSCRRFAHHNCNEPSPPANSTIPCSGSDVAARKQRGYHRWLVDLVFVFLSKISTASEQLCPEVQLRDVVKDNNTSTTSISETTPSIHTQTHHRNPPQKKQVLVMAAMQLQDRRDQHSANLWTKCSSCRQICLQHPKFRLLTFNCITMCQWNIISKFLRKKSI